LTRTFATLQQYIWLNSPQQLASYLYLQPQPIVKGGYIRAAVERSFLSCARRTHLTHGVPEVIGIEHQLYAVANLLRYAEIGRVIGRQTFGIHHEGIVGSFHQLSQIVEQSGVVVFGPSKLFGKGNKLIGLFPRAVILGINHHVLVANIPRVGLSKEIIALLQSISARSVWQFA